MWDLKVLLLGFSKATSSASQAQAAAWTLLLHLLLPLILMRASSWAMVRMYEGLVAMVEAPPAAAPPAADAGGEAGPSGAAHRAVGATMRGETHAQALGKEAARRVLKEPRGKRAKGKGAGEAAGPTRGAGVRTVMCGACGGEGHNIQRCPSQPGQGHGQEAASQGQGAEAGGRGRGRNPGLVSLPSLGARAAVCRLSYPGPGAPAAPAPRAPRWHSGPHARARAHARTRATNAHAQRR